MKRIFKVTLFLVIALYCLQTQAVVNKGGESVKYDKEAVNAVVKETWEFYSIYETPDAQKLASASNHKFGKEVGYMYDKFLAMYVVKEEIVPGDPNTRTVIRKPSIYNAVRVIEKELNKQVKGEQISTQEATDEFSKVLKVALAAIDSESGTFEDSLQAYRKDASTLLAIFDHVRLKNLY